MFKLSVPFESPRSPYYQQRLAVKEANKLRHNLSLELIVFSGGVALARCRRRMCGGQTLVCRMRLRMALFTDWLQAEMTSLILTCLSIVVPYVEPSKEEKSTDLGGR